ncbi:MAG: hypothetical protein ACLFPF_07125 [Halanaerobiales bacterium]
MKKENKTVNIPINIGAEGIVTVIETDIRNKGHKKIKQYNLLLDDYLDAVFTNGAGLFYIESGTSNGAFAHLYVGTDNTPTSREQMGIVGDTLVTVEKEEILSQGEIIEGDVISKARFVVPAGVGTGEVGELALQSGDSSYSETRNRWVSRIAFDPKINKSEYIQLDIIWEIRVKYGNSIWTGVLENGQRDGSSVEWTATINNEQKQDLFSVVNSIGVLSAISNLGYLTFNMVVKVGDSNASSSIETDGKQEIKGNLLFEGESENFVSEWDYNSTAREYSFSIRIGTNEANGAFAEIMIGADRDNSGLMRITFDPPLDKVDTHRVYINPTFTFNLGGA